jgi:hypothetical protein
MQEGLYAKIKIFRVELHRIVIWLDIQLIWKPDAGYPVGYHVRPDTGFRLNI